MHRAGMVKYYRYTRNKNILLHLLKLKLKYGRRSTKIFNGLPTEVRKHCKEKNFNILNNHFFTLKYCM